MAEHRESPEALPDGPAVPEEMRATVSKRPSRSQSSQIDNIGVQPHKSSAVDWYAL